MDNELERVLKVLENADVHLYIGDIVEGGCRDISIKDVPKFIENPVKFFAELYNVSVEQLTAYMSYSNDHHQCTAMTRANKRCKNLNYGDVKVSEFKYGESTLCAGHLKHFLSDDKSAF